MSYSPWGIKRSDTAEQTHTHTLIQTFYWLNQVTQWSEITKPCLTLCDLMDCSLPDSSVHGILQARVLEWVATPSSRGSSQPRDRTCGSCTAGRFFTCWTTWEAHPITYVCLFHMSSVQFSSVTQSCPTLCDPMNHSMPGLPVHHHLQEFTQTHVHRVRDAIQPSHPGSSSSPPAPNPFQHQSLFQWVNSSHEVAKVPEFQL